MPLEYALSDTKTPTETEQEAEERVIHCALRNNSK